MKGEFGSSRRRNRTHNNTLAFIICEGHVSKCAHDSAGLGTYVFKTWKDEEERKEFGREIAYKFGAWMLPAGLTELRQLQTTFCNRTTFLQTIERAMGFIFCPTGHIASRQARVYLQYSSWSRLPLLTSLPAPRRSFHSTRRRLAEGIERAGEGTRNVADADFWKEYKGSCMFLSI